MKISKAIQKQKNSLIGFLFFMGFIFVALPLILFAYGALSFVNCIYLAVIEGLVVIESFIRIDKYNLIFEYDCEKIRIKHGLFKKEITLVIDKILYVDILGNGKDMKIVLLLRSRFRNRLIKEISSVYLRKNSQLVNEYNEIRVKYPGKRIYYLELYKGGYIKYELIDMLYRCCHNTRFSEKTIDYIKNYRK